MAGLDSRIGSLTPGKQGDVILLRKGDLNLFPVIDPVRSIVLHAGTVNVDTVLVSGRVMKRDGKLLYPELAAKKERLAATTERIVSQAASVLH
jgi:cytosine/adenosine deaminase-related metal-dependent hydrolase